MRLFFFPVKGEILYFSTMFTCGHLCGHRGRYLHFQYGIAFENFGKCLKFQIKISLPLSAEVSANINIQKVQSLTFHWKKKLMSKLFQLFFQSFETICFKKPHIFSVSRPSMTVLRDQTLYSLVCFNLSQHKHI